MKSILEATLTSRKMLAPFLENYTLEQLNTIPSGFSNNMIWNIGHIIVSQQILVYRLSGLPLMVSDEMISKYKKDSRPEGPVTQAELDEIKSLLLKNIEQTIVDFDNNLFVNFTPYTTSTGGHQLNNAEDAMAFNNFHEGIHLGIVMSIKKFV